MLQISIDTNRGGYWTYGKPDSPEKEFVKIRMPHLPEGVGPEELEKIKYLTIADRALETQRRTASWDHEHHRNGKGKTWHGAAIVRTKDGHGYVISNIHLCRDDAARNCAETLSFTISFSDLGEMGQVEEIIFTGGPAIPWGKHPRFVLKENVGKRYAPCGSCAGVVHDFGLPGGGTVVTLVPHGIDKKDPVLPYDGRKRGKLLPNQAYSAEVRKFLPQLAVSLPDPQGDLKQTIRRGRDFIKTRRKEPKFDIRREVLALEDMEEQKQNPQLIVAQINKIMMREFQHLYRETDRKTQSAHIVIERTGEGKYYAGVDYTNAKTHSTHPAVDNSIGDKRAVEPKGRITNVFSMHCDYAKLRASRKSPVRTNARIGLQLVDGNGRERIKKGATGAAISLEGERLQSGDALVHEFLLNGIDCFDPRRHITTKHVKRLLPNGYDNPKATHAAHRPGARKPVSRVDASVKEHAMA